MILYASYLESSLSYLLYFHGAQIKMVSVNFILNRPTVNERWKHFADYSFRRNFLDGKRKALNLVNLQHTNFNRYQYISSLIENEIKAIIEIRNKLAHGQWAIAFNSDGDEKNQEVTTKLWTLSKKDVITTKNIVTKFTEIMHALISSEDHFSSIFDKAVGALEENKITHEEQYSMILEYIKRRKRPSQV